MLPNKVTPEHLGSLRCKIALLPDSHIRPGLQTSIPKHPTKRLYECARFLFEKYLHKLSTEVDAIFLLGDTLDPADSQSLQWLQQQIEGNPIPVHTIIGNHETYGNISAEEFHQALGLPSHGNYLARVKGVPFLMLATPSQSSLSPGHEGFQWLESQLQNLSNEDLFCCAHWSLLLHPCVEGWRNDGMQQLYASGEILALLHKYRNVRAWIAGHKNVPSKLIQGNVLHLLSPQLIQAPCGYRILHIHENAIVSSTYEIEETDLADLSRRAYGNEYPDRHGNNEDRDFVWYFEKG